MKKVAALAVFVAMSFVFAQPALTHCEVPCGIYDDQMRVQMIREHITTIEKAMKKIVELSNQSPVNYNQIVRWTMNKEEHAEELQHIVQQYFMTQRIKPVDSGDGGKYDKYVEQVTLLHQMLVITMKTKQTTDTGHIETLRALTDQFDKSYFEDK
ncbi:MAG: superoxide dismutase [Candidatus Krumholzibacteria bacterium]|nr:superoxide dismutase [Candidatus Krumholzibacteria bacterium]